MARVSGHEYPDEATFEEDGAEDEGEYMEEGEEEEDHEHDEIIEDEGEEQDEVVETPKSPLNPSPNVRSSTKSPAELHDAIRPSPTASPSGSHIVRSMIQSKLQMIKALELELGLPCFGI